MHSSRDKGHADLLRSVPHEHVPACYGGQLGALPRATAHELGFAGLPDALSRELLPGPAKWMGRFHLPPEQQGQAQRDADRR